MCIIYLKRILFIFFVSEIKHKYENAKVTVNVPGTHDHDEGGIHSVIGLALVLGFVFMLLIDQIGTSKSRGKFIYDELRIQNNN